MTAASSSRYAAPALTKGLRIIEELASHDGGRSLTEIARGLRYSVNEIFRMVVALQEAGYIEPGADDKYRLTLKLFEIAHRLQPVRSLVATAAPLMRELADRQLQSCHLAVHHEGRAMIVAQMDSPEPWTLNVKVGAIIGLLDTSSGLVMLAYADAATRERMLAAHAALGGEQPVDLDALERRLAAIRRDGHLILPSLQTALVTNIACPVFGAGARIAAVLTVPYAARPTPGAAPSIADTASALRAAAAQLSRLLGWEENSFSLATEHFRS